MLFARILLILGLLLAWMPNAFACIISPGSGVGPTHTTHGYNYALHGWFIGPQTIEADPADQWFKTLLNPTRAGSQLYLVELLKVSGTTALTGWHEEIKTKGWDWVSGKLYTLNSAPNRDSFPANFLTGVPATATGTITRDGDYIDFGFSPLNPGSWVLIVKELVWDESESERHRPSRRIEILESAVPIPATAWLLGAGLVGLVAIRRRKSNPA